MGIAIGGLSNELRDLGQSIGILDSGGDFDPNWLGNPLAAIESVLQQPEQRAAFLRFLDDIAPPASINGLPSGEKWHPLLGNPPNGNLYLTVRDLSGPVQFGLAGDFGSGAGPSVQARLRAQIAIVQAGATFGLAGGSTTGPLIIELRLDLNWTRGSGAGQHPIGLGAVVIHATITPDPAHPAFDLQVILEGLQLTADPAIDKVLDTQDLGRDAPSLLAGLLKAVLAEAGADPTAILLANHFLGLLGLDDSGTIPQFPFASLADGPQALRQWLGSLISGSAPAAIQWLQHFAGLFGSSIAVQGPATGPWSVQLLPLGSVGGLSLTVENTGPQARFGVQASLGASLGAGEPTLTVAASAAIADIPLNGTGTARVLPAASVLAIFTGSGGGELISDPAVHVGSLRGGAVWDGATLRPTLELLNVTFGAAPPYPKLDLTNLESVEQGLAGALAGIIDSALGPGVGRSLAAIAGIIPPTTAPGAWPHHLNLAALVSNPAAAFGQYHREVLLDATNNWGFIFADVAGLVGATPVTGSGTAADPWVVPLAAPIGPLTLELAAWNAQTTPGAGQPQLLRVGLRLAADSGNVHFSLAAELLAFDLPASGAANLSFIGTTKLLFRMQPAINFAISDQASISLDSAELAASFSPAAGLSWGGTATNFAIHAGSSTFAINSLALPPAGGFDIQHMDTTAAALGLTATQLESAVCFLLSFVIAQVAPELYVTAVLAGLHHDLADLPSDAPLLPDPANPGRLFSDPLAAIRGWVERTFAFVDTSGMPYVLRLLAWAAALIEGRLPNNVTADAPAIDTLEGSGLFDDPWHLGDFRLWLEPAGPSVAWATGAATLANASTDLAGLAQALHLLARLHSPLAAAIGDLSPDDISARLQALALHLSTSDGVVALDSQSPEIFGWGHADPIANAHDKLPGDPAAITQIRTQIESFVDSSHPRLVVLLGPAFLDRHAWDALLASPGLAGVTNPAANFNLRTPGIDPATVSLVDVTAVADYYTAELADDNSGDVSKLQKQIENIAARLAVLQPGRTITLVAHSTAGLAARAYANAHPDRVRALITLAAPHMGAPLPFLTDLATGDGVRIAQVLRDAIPASALRDALDHLLHAMDGYLPASAASSLPTPFPYLAASFNSGAPFDTGTVPVVALQGHIADDPFAVLQAAAAALAGQVAASGRTAPTHLGVGVAIAMDLPAAAGNAIQTEAELRATLFQIPLHDGVAAAPARPQLRAEIRLSRPGAWLLSGPALGDSRVRDLALRLDVTGSTPAVSLELHDAAWHAPMQPIATSLDPIALSVLGDAMRALTDAEAPLVNALTALTIATTNAAGDLGISSDAWSTMLADPFSLIRAHLPDALSSPGGFLGITGPSSGPWQWQPNGSPLALLITCDAPTGPYHIGISAGAGGVIELDITTPLPSLALQINAGLTLGVLQVRWQSATGSVTVAAPPWLDSLTVVPPPGPAALAAALNDVWPRLLFSGVIDLVLSVFAPDVRIDRIESFLRDTGAFLQGNINGAKINALLQRLNQAAGLPAGPGLQLPGSISITSSGGASATDPIRIDAATTANIGGVFGFDLGVRIDSLRHVTPSGSISLDTDLTGTWPHITVTFGVSDAGLSLVITPQGLSPIQILPTFGGLGSLVAAGSELLIGVLQAIVNSFHGAPPAWFSALLTAATDLSIYDAGGGFTAHSAELRAMLQGDWFATFDAARQASVANAVSDVVRLIPGLPGTVGATGGLITWSFPVVAGQPVSFGVGWGDTGPSLRVSAQNIRPSGAPLGGSASVQVGTAGVQADVRVQVFLDSVGINATPTFDVEVLTSPAVQFRARLLPLANNADDGPLTIQLAPDFSFNATADMAIILIENWALPLLARVALQAAQAELARPIWNGGPTVQQALQNAGILDTFGHVALPLPNLFEMITGFLSAASTVLNLPIGDLHLRLASADSRIGIGISGKQNFSIGDFQLTLLFGAPTDWGAPAAEGAIVWLIQTGGESIQFNFGLWLHGVGIGIEGAGGDPLINDSNIRIGGLNFYSFLELETASGLAVNHIGGGAELADFGLPLGAVTGNASGSGSNPVASNLMKSGGGNGDPSPANPKCDLDLWYWDYPGMPTPPFQIRLNGQQGVLWIGVHAGFGPVYIDQVGVELSSTNVGLLIDGGVSIAGFTAQVDDLTIGIPFNSISNPTGWTLDLKGLALGYSGPEIEIAGGLVKFDGPPIEYDGMLLIKVSEIGLVVVGSYAVISGADGYTSIAILGGVFIPLGIPPIINLTGFALGMGYNRKLIVPDDLNLIPSFPLVQALDRPEQLANNPMQALIAFRNASPASRGSFWFAAGLRGTTFQVVNVTAILYVALDTGVEVGLLGVARMTLPSDDTALVNIELALKVRFSSAEGLFSVQAQLTDNSWLLSHDCQLTGGFAYFMWFKESQFLLTMGGYNPSFQPRPEYPIVPRLGYHWDLLGVIHIKGESYFALTNTCVMAGTRMEVTYGPDWLQLWYTAYADFLISWDPFHYQADIGVEIGARFRMEICFIGCVHIDISVSLGASLNIEGPPLHGIVTVDLAIATVSVEFGTRAHPKPPQLTWDQFSLQYLQPTDPATVPLGVQVMTGLLPAQPPGGPVAPGTADQPWLLTAEWSFRTETKMAARGFFFQTQDPRTENQMGAEPLGLYNNLSTVYAFDIAPMYAHSTDIDRAIHGVTIFARGSNTALPLDKTLFAVEPIIGQVSEATWHFFPDFNPPAAANTLPVLAGIKIFGIPRLNGQSQIIPIAKLRDATNPRPLPFASRTIDIVAVLQAAGLIADTFSALSATKGSQALLGAYSSVLSGSTGVFAGLRSQTGLPRPGLSPVAVESLQTRRSSPPVLAPLSYGLSMDAPAQNPPTIAATVDPQAPVALVTPRLRAVLQQQVAPTVAAIAPIRTTVTTIKLAAALPRVSIDRDLQRNTVIPGARLLLRPADNAPRPTRVARGLRTARHAHLGAVTPRGVAASMTGIENAALEKGAALRAGVTHLWELPASQVAAIHIVSDMPVRVVFLTSAGTLLTDAEYANAAQLAINVPAGSGMVAITGLGAVAGAIPPGIVDGASGAVTASLAPAGTKAITGWQVGMHVAQTGASTMLGRGSTLLLSQVTGARISQQTMSLGMVPLSQAAIDQVAVQTYLPGSCTVVGVLLDAKEGGAIGPDTIAVASDGATLKPSPIRVQGGDRTLLLFDVAPLASGAPPEEIPVTVSTAGGFHLAGVVGTHGSAQTWGAELNGGILSHLVPDTPLSPAGLATLRFEMKPPPNNIQGES